MLLELLKLMEDRQVVATKNLVVSILMGEEGVDYRFQSTRFYGKIKERQQVMKTIAMALREKDISLHESGTVLKLVHSEISPLKTTNPFFQDLNAPNENKDEANILKTLLSSGSNNNNNKTKSPWFMDAKLPSPPYLKKNQNLMNINKKDQQRNVAMIRQLNTSSASSSATTTTTTTSAINAHLYSISSANLNDGSSTKPINQLIASANLNAATNNQEEENAESVLTPDQKSVLDAVRNGQSIFFTGCAGSGKSFVLKKLIETETQLRANNTVFVTATTGMAACLIGGTTINSFAGIGLGKEDVSFLVQRIMTQSSTVKRWRSCSLLVVDEVSMLDSVLLEKLEAIARKVRDSNVVFGGIQVVLCGDFYQLPPVTEFGGGGGGSNNHKENVPFCFLSKMWDRIIQKTIVLKEVFRQKDTRLIKFLNEIRNGVVSAEGEALIKERSVQPHQKENGPSSTIKIQPTRLFARNFDADRVNEEKLKELKTKIYKFLSMDNYKDEKTLKMLEQSPAAKELHLCVGAQVVLLKNIPGESLVNGSRGVVVGFEIDAGHACTSRTSSLFASNEFHALKNSTELLPLVCFNINGVQKNKLVGRCEYEIVEGTNKLGSRIQLPLRCAWAMSMHKSQGLTIDSLHVDLSGIFEYHQAYVALSRASCLESLTISGYSKSKNHTIMCHPSVVAFYKRLEAATKQKQENNDSAEDNESNGKRLRLQVAEAPPQELYPWLTRGGVGRES